MRLVGRVTPRQAPEQDVPRLEEPPGGGEDLGLVRAEPEDLRPHVEGPGGVAGPPMHRPRANFPAHPFGFRDGAVVPIQETGTGGAATQGPPAPVWLSASLGASTKFSSGRSISTRPTNRR